YRATLSPWLWLLTRTSDCRIFQNQKVPDIIESIFKDQGFNDYKLKLSAGYSPREYCVQYRETDFNFVSRLMEEEGIYYFFQHQNGKHILTLADSPSAHDPFPGYDTLTYRPASARQEEQRETVTDWIVEKEIQPTMYELNDFNFTTPKAAVTGNDSISRQHQKADNRFFDYPGGFQTPDQGATYAKLRIQELQAQYETAQASATVRGAATGCKFSLKGHPRSDQNRQYLIIGTSIRASAGSYESGKPSEGEFFSCTFTAIPATQQFRTLRTTPKPLIRGPQTAIVTGQDGQEIYTDEYGRVKLHFHWDRHDKKDENSSCWVRVSQNWAGKTWGSMHIPRIGQEVIVEFLEGDPDRPIITGRVYNADQMPPYELPANKTQSGIKSRSSTGGSTTNFNEIRFEDKKGSEQVSIQAEKDMLINIKNNSNETIGKDRTLTVKGKETKEVDDDVTETYKAALSQTVSKDVTLTYQGALSQTVTKDVTETFNSGHTEQTTKTYSLQADTVAITGQTKVTITVGGSSITIDSNGIKINSSAALDMEAQSQLTVKSSGTAEVSASGTMDISGAMTSINS
ncbi:MAG TPA: type VI secretion system tip protein TssI/VgrG, partial [Verrucomicrobiae bacterium]|nr:type VI secretion system tip protein TssI/VgrG [Verrucomicrobiae bacterium]